MSNVGPRLWLISGEHPDGHVDVSDGAVNVLVHVPRMEAERAVVAQLAKWERWYAKSQGWPDLGPRLGEPGWKL